MKNNPNFIPKEYDQPKFFKTVGYSYLTEMGSHSYGTENEDSDYDFYGYIVPSPEIVFPHLAGHIQGFGRTWTPFEQYQVQHIQHGKYGEIDLTVYNIVKYFQLVMSGNPNMVDSLFTLNENVVHSDEVGDLVKENRHLFLSEKMYHTFKGMAWSHASRLKNGTVKEGRRNNVEKFSWDTKDGYHTLRILLQIKDVLETGDLNLKKYSRFLRDVRDGMYDLDTVLLMFETLMRDIDKVVENGSVVPHSPDENKIKQLLVDCLEIKYGSLSNFGYKE